MYPSQHRRERLLVRVTPNPKTRYGGGVDAGQCPATQQEAALDGHPGQREPGAVGTKLTFLSAELTYLSSKLTFQY
jgi:hypothetical protein